MSSEKYRIMNVVFEITAKTDELPPPPKKQRLMSTGEYRIMLSILSVRMVNNFFICTVLLC